MEDLAHTLTKYLNFGLDFIDKTLPSGLDTFGINVVRANFTRTQLDIVQTGQEIQKERANGMSGFKIFYIIFLTIFTILVVFPNIWWLIVWYKTKKDRSESIDQEFSTIPPEIKNVKNLPGDMASLRYEGADSLRPTQNSVKSMNYAIMNTDSDRGSTVHSELIKQR